MTGKIRVGIIGTSWWADMMYLPSFASHPDAEVVAICGRNRDPAEKLAADYDIGAVYTDYRDLLAHGGLDAAVIATPDDTHHEMTLAALDAGLHVICEKPLANNAADAREMYERAETAGVKHMVLFTWRLLPHFRYMKKLVDDGFVGRPRHLQLAFVGGHARVPAYDWHLDPARANGMIADLGTHVIDLFRNFAGEIRSVSADLRCAVDRSAFIAPSAPPANDSGFVLLHAVDGTQGLVHVSAVEPTGDREVELKVSIAGDSGMLESTLIFFGPERGIRLRGIGAGESRMRSLDVPPGFLDVLAQDDYLAPFSSQSIGPRLFIDAIRDDLPIPMTFFDGWKAQQVVDAALQSSRERRCVDVS